MSAMTASIWVRSSSETRCGVLIARDTVMLLTPTRVAMSARVARSDWVGRGFRIGMTGLFTKLKRQGYDYSFFLQGNVCWPPSTGQISVIVENSAMICCGAASKMLYKLSHDIKIHVNVSANINRNDGKYGRAQ